MTSKYTVYIHKNKVNGKVYIGQTCQKPSRRWGINGSGYKGQPFYAAIQKYGWNNFEHIILKQNLSLEEANLWEKYYIKKYNSSNSNFGYNCTLGGKSFKVSELTRKKMSEAHKGNKLSEEQKRKIKINNKGKHSFKHTLEAKNKIKEKHKRKVQCINTQKIFNSIQEACQWCGLKMTSQYNISRVCNGKRKTAGKHPSTQEALKWRWIN